MCARKTFSKKSETKRNEKGKRKKQKNKIQNKVATQWNKKIEEEEEKNIKE